MDRGAWRAIVREIARVRHSLATKQQQIHSPLSRKIKSINSQYTSILSKWQPTRVFVPGESHGQKSLAGYSIKGHKRWTHWSDLAHACCPIKCSTYWRRASLVAQLVKNLPAMRETWVRSLGWEDSLEKGTVTHLNYKQ